MEGTPKIETKDIALENERNYLERLKQSLKPLFAYGIYALVSLNGGESNAQHQRVESKEENKSITHDENNRTLLDQSLVMKGENGFNYYNPSILMNYETFYTYAEKDEGFKKSWEYISVSERHSQIGKDKLQMKINFLKKHPEASRNKELIQTFENQLENFQIIGSEDDLFNIAMSIKYEMIVSHIEDIEKQKKWLVDITSSEEYLKRLTHEYQGNEKKAQRIQKKRVERLLRHDYLISNSDGLSMDGAIGHVLDRGEHKYSAALPNESTAATNLVTYKEGNGAEFLERDNNLTPLHEFEHQANVKFISAYAKHLFRNFDQSEMFNYQLKKIEYYTKPTEVLARKRVFDYELEQLDIKAYDEEFSEDHYQQIQELLGKGILDTNSEEFFRTFRKDGIMLIMNTVAEALNQNKTIDWNDAVNLKNERIT